jgi:DNA-binding beta-propeller fold protein YncE
MMRAVAIVVGGLVGSLSSGCSSSGQDAGADAGGATAMLQDVLLVGNSVSGSVSFVDGHTFKNLGSIDIIPDLQQRLADINANPLWSVAYSTIKQHQTIKHFEPSGGDRFIDDAFVSLDGTKLYVSRSNLGDVAAFDLTKASHPMLWRTRVDGFKADHATLSPDGSRLVVSATSANVADVLDARTGTHLGSFPTGAYPHQNDYSADGKHIYNGSIGDVSLPQAQDAQKGVRQLTVADARTLKVIKTYPFMEGIRPSVISADETTMYCHSSYLNGLLKYDLTTAAIVQTLQEPLSAFAMANYPTPDDYPHDSAHHGLAMSGDGTKLCEAGTIDNTVSIVAVAGLSVQATLDTGMIPYWATTSADGKYCFVSLSGDGAVSVVDYAKAQEVTRTPVGKFPQRSRLGRVPVSALHLLSPATG